MNPRLSVKQTTILTAVAVCIAVGSGAVSTGTSIGLVVGAIAALAVIALATFFGPSRH